MIQNTQNKLKSLLSIIVVTKNDYKNLLLTNNTLTFSSDIRQKIQLILIDGDSTDETKSFMKSHSSDFDIIISEQDKGIYDAMNKGIQLAEGEWTIFMNSGDTFADSKVIGKIFENPDTDCDVIYGDCVLKYPGFDILKKATDLKDIWKGMITTHQSFVIKTHLLKENRFDLDYQLGADFDQIYKLFKQGKKFRYLQIPIAAVDTSGVSNRKMVKAKREHFKSLKNDDVVDFRIRCYYTLNLVFLNFLTLFRLLFTKKFYYTVVKFINSGRIERE